MTLTGDSRKVVDAFCKYVLTDDEASHTIADAMYYDHDELVRRARVLQAQLEQMDETDR